jgi:hypothetical protein
VASKCKPVTIGVPDSCKADFERLPSPNSNPRLAYFKALPQHNNNRKPSKVCWSFGEGGRGDTCINYAESYTGLYVASHPYQHPGQYQVCVQITYYGGCVAYKCKTIQIMGANQPVLVLSPNPVINIMHVDFLSTHTEQVTIKIMNAMGNPVRTNVRNVTTGPNAWNEDLTNLLPGIYSYIVQSQNQTASAIFIKL